MTTTLQQPQGDTLSSADLAGSPALTPEMIIGDLVSTAVKGDGPGLVPPGVQASASAGAASLVATTTNATVTGLWTNNATSNAYAYLAGKGWRKLSSANAIAYQALLELARVARDTGASVQCEEDGSVIHSMYVW
jgi:hypothetical protein